MAVYFFVATPFHVAIYFFIAASIWPSTSLLQLSHGHPIVVVKVNMSPIFIFVLQLEERT